MNNLNLKDKYMIEILILLPFLFAGLAVGIGGIYIILHLNRTCRLPWEPEFPKGLTLPHIFYKNEKLFYDVYNMCEGVAYETKFYTCVNNKPGKFLFRLPVDINDKDIKPGKVNEWIDHVYTNYLNN